MKKFFLFIVLIYINNKINCFTLINKNKNFKINLEHVVAKMNEDEPSEIIPLKIETDYKETFPVNRVLPLSPGCETGNFILNKQLGKKNYLHVVYQTPESEQTYTFLKNIDLFSERLLNSPETEVIIDQLVLDKRAKEVADSLAKFGLHQIPLVSLINEYVGFTAVIIKPSEKILAQDLAAYRQLIPEESENCIIQ